MFTCRHSYLENHFTVYSGKMRVKFMKEKWGIKESGTEPRDQEKGSAAWLLSKKLLNVLEHDWSRRKEQIPKVRQLKADVINDRVKQVCSFSFKKTENRIRKGETNKQKTVQESHSPNRKRT